MLDLQSKSMDWFLYDNRLRHERVKYCKEADENVYNKYSAGSLKKIFCSRWMTPQLVAINLWSTVKKSSFFHYLYENKMVQFYFPLLGLVRAKRTKTVSIKRSDSNYIQELTRNFNSAINKENPFGRDSFSRSLNSHVGGLFQRKKNFSV